MSKTKAFVITSSCEKSCVYCINENIDDMTFSEFKEKLDDEINHNFDFKKVVLTGGNPVLNKDFFEMCKYVKEKKLKLKIAGTFSSKIEQYAELVDEVSIALDSLKEKINDKLRGKDSFIQSKKAIDYFIKNKIKVQIHTVVNSLNINEIKEMYKYLIKENFFINNSWKLFRYIKFNNNPDYSVNDGEWKNIKSIKNDEEIYFIDDVLEY